MAGVEPLAASATSRAVIKRKLHANAINPLGSCSSPHRMANCDCLDTVAGGALTAGSIPSDEYVAWHSAVSTGLTDTAAPSIAAQLGWSNPTALRKTEAVTVVLLASNHAGERCFRRCAI